MPGKLFHISMKMNAFQLTLKTPVRYKRSTPFSTKNYNKVSEHKFKVSLHLLQRFKQYDGSIIFS